MLNRIDAAMNDLQKLSLQVADLDQVERSHYYKEHEVGRDLRQEVESLLRFDNGSANPLTGVVGETMEQFTDSAQDRFCGPYERVRLLGKGGMGSVHLAHSRDGEVDLLVAEMRGLASIVRRSRASESCIHSGIAT